MFYANGIDVLLFVDTLFFITDSQRLLIYI